MIEADSVPILLAAIVNGQAAVRRRRRDGRKVHIIQLKRLARLEPGQKNKDENGEGANYGRSGGTPVKFCAARAL